MATAAPRNWWDNDPTTPPPSARPAAPVTMPRPFQGLPREAPLHTQQTPAEVTIQQGQAAAAPMDAEAARARIDAEHANAARAGQAVTQSNTQGLNFTDEHTLRDEYQRHPAVRNYETAIPLFASATQAGPGGAGDLQIVYSFARVMDPLTGVREGEQAGIANTGGTSEQIRGWIQSIQNGGRLPPEVRNRLLHEIRTRVSQYGDAYRQERAAFGSRAQQYGFDPTRIIGPNAGEPFQQAEADFLGRPVRNMDNSQGPEPRNQQIQPIAQTGDGRHAPPGTTLEFTGWTGDPNSARPPGAVEFQRELETRLQSGGFTTPQQIIDFAANYHLPDGTPQHYDIRPDQAAAAIRARGRISVTTPSYAPPDISGQRGGRTGEAADATMRSVANAALAGIPDRAAALGDTMFSGGTYDENVRRQHAITDFDWQHHFPASTVGTLLGGVMLPTGAPGAARTAAVDAIRLGSTRADALAIGREAAATRLGGEGTAYGTISGYTGSDDHPLRGMVTGAALGGTGAYGLGEFGGMMRFGERGPRPSALPPLVGESGRLNTPLEAASPGQRVAAAGEFGINLPMGAATDRGGAILEKGLDILPASAGVMNDSRRVASGQATAAVDSVASRYGSAPPTLHAAGQEYQRGAQNWINRATGVPRTGDRGVVGRAYDAIPISPNAPTTLTNAQAVLSRMTGRFASNPDLAASLNSPQLARYLTAIERHGLNWQDLKDFRSQIGAQIGEARFSDTPPSDDLRALYGALSEDMRASAVAQGPRALRSFERANNLNREVEDRIEQGLVHILGDDSRNNPEAAARMMQTISKSGTGSSDLNRLAMVRRSMMKGREWDEASSSLIRLMGQPLNREGREFNPQTFVQNYADMSAPARDLLFGGPNRELRQALDRFVSVSQRLAGTSALRNKSQSATGLTAAGTIGAIISGIMNPLLGAKVVAAGAINYGAARLWTSPKFVRLVTNAAATRSPSVARRTLRRGLASLARSSPALAADIDELDQNVFGGPQ